MLEFMRSRLQLLTLFMKTATFSTIAASLALTLATVYAEAATLGEISLRSRIGERLLADIPIQLAPGETLELQCFSLQAANGNDLPNITQARLKLWRNESSARIIVEGSHPLLEPISLLRIRAGCEQNNVRDYVLMPDSPSSTIAPVRVIETRGNEAEGQIREAAPKPSKTSVARSQPNTQEVRARRENSAPRSAPITQVATSEPRDPRLRLGMPNENEASGHDAERAQLEEMSNRVLRMESSMNSLREEVDKLHGAVEVGAQAMSIKHELQLASQLQNAPPSQEPELAPAAGVLPVQAPPPVSRPQGINWLELLIAALGGGIVSSLVAAILIRRSLRRKD